MLLQTKNGTLVNYILTRSKNKRKKYEQSTPRNQKRLSVFEDFAKLRYSVDLHNKHNQKSVTGKSISDIKQQIHKLRTQSIQLSFSPLTTERAASSLFQNTKTTNHPIANNILQIINTQSHSKFHKPKDLLPKITLNKNNQQNEPIRYLQDRQIATNITKTKQPYLISSVVRVPRIVRHRLNKLAHSDLSNQIQVKINQSISRWQSSQIQEPFLREMSNP